MKNNLETDNINTPDSSISTQNFPESDAVTLPEVKRKFKYKPYILFIIIIILSVTFFLLLNLNLRKTTDQKDTSFFLTPTTQSYPKYKYICLNATNSFSENRDYEKGTVAINFNWDLTLKDALNFLNSQKLQTIKTQKENKPLGIIIKWTELFESGQKVSVQEVNDFLELARNETYIHDVEVSTYWHSWPLRNIDPSLKWVEEIDRWGYFTVVFSDITKKDQFFEKYPQATYISDGETSGILFRKVNPNKVTIIFKGSDAMQILGKIRENIGRGDNIEIASDFVHTQYDTLNGERISLTEYSDKYPIIFLHEIRNTADTSYETALSVHFPNSFTPEEIYNELAKFPQIDINNIEVPVYSESEWVYIKVPEGQEGCWAKELKKEPEINYVSLIAPKQ